MCSGVFQSAYIWAGLDFMVKLSNVWLLGILFFSPWVVSVGVRIFDLRTLQLVRSKGASRKTHIHLIWRTWQSRGRLFVSWFLQTGFVVLRQRMMTQWLSYIVVASLPRICLWSMSVWGMCTTYPSFQTAWSQWLWQCCLKRRGCR